MSRLRDYFLTIGDSKSEDPFYRNEARANVSMALIMISMGIIDLIVIILALTSVLTIRLSGLIGLAIGGFLITGSSVYALVTKGQSTKLKYAILFQYCFFAAMVRAYLGEFGFVLLVLGVLLSARYFDRRFTLLIIGFATFAFLTSQSGVVFGMDPDPTIGGTSVQVSLDPVTNKYVYDIKEGQTWVYFGKYWQHNGLPNLLLWLFAIQIAFVLAYGGRTLVKDEATHYAKETAEHSELVMAQEIQKAMLPRNFPLFPQYEDINVYAIMNPAKEVGGDFYDAFTVDDDHIAFLIADVSGKGIPAAMFMALAKAIIKTQAVASIDPGVTMSAVNDSLREGNDINFFVTAWMGVMNTKTGELKYVNAGHNPPLFARANNHYEYLKDISGPVLTARANHQYKVFSLKLQKGDRIFLYTDGVTEAENKDRDQYGPKRLRDYLNTAPRSSIRFLVKGVEDEVAKFVDGFPQSDDMTILMFEFGAYSKAFFAKDENIPLITSTADRFLAKYGADERTIRQFDVVLDEVLANICHYAYGPGEKGTVNVTLYFDDKNNTFMLALSDKGVAFNPLEMAEPDVSLPSEEREAGGLGIYMVKRLVDEVKYHRYNGENILVMTKKLK